ncbi:hypothetical protein MMPV_008511 [Pyropia vietnamensis]
MLLPLPSGPVAALLTAAAATTAAATVALRTDLLSPFPPPPLSGAAGRRCIGVVDARLPASVSPARLRVRLFYPAVSPTRGVGRWVPRRRASWLPPSFGRPWEPHTTAAGIVAFIKGPSVAGLLLSSFAALRLRALAAPPLAGRASPTRDDADAERRQDGIRTAAYGAAPAGSAGGNGAAALASVSASLGDARLPLILFSHGLAGSVCGYTSTCTALAAAGDGALVVAVEHADGSAFCTQVTGPDGQPVTIPYTTFADAASARGLTDERAFREAQVDQRVAELTAAVAGVAAWAAGEEAVEPLGRGGGVDLAGRVDASRVAVVGHSFGAATAFTYSHVARRAAAAATGRGKDGTPAPTVYSCVMHDAWMYAVPNKLLQDGVAVPTLFITAERSSMPQSLAAQQTLLGVDAARVKRGSGDGSGGASPPTVDGSPAVAWVELVGALHNNQSDFPVVLPRWVATRAGMTAPDIDAAAVAGANSAVTAAWVTDAWGRAGRSGRQAGVSAAVAALPDPAAVRVVANPGEDRSAGARATGRTASRLGKRG